MNNDEQYDKFLPLGSIVTIKGHQQPVMIIKIHYSKDVDYLENGTNIRRKADSIIGVMSNHFSLKNLYFI